VTSLFVSRDFEPASDLSRRLGLRFSKLSMLTRALTHRSYVNENPEATEDNERLEFLGDAVLDFIVGAWVYNRFPEMPEGDLTKMRSALVRNDQLAEFARHLNLGPALRLGRGKLPPGEVNATDYWVRLLRHWSEHYTWIQTSKQWKILSNHYWRECAN